MPWQGWGCALWGAGGGLPRRSGLGWAWEGLWPGRELLPGHRARSQLESPGEPDEVGVCEEVSRGFPAGAGSLRALGGLPSEGVSGPRWGGDGGRRGPGLGRAASASRGHRDCGGALRTSYLPSSLLLNAIFPPRGPVGLRLIQGLLGREKGNPRRVCRGRGHMPVRKGNGGSPGVAAWPRGGREGGSRPTPEPRTSRRALGVPLLATSCWRGWRHDRDTSSG